jgi:hypothetical protein
VNFEACVFDGRVFSRRVSTGVYFRVMSGRSGILQVYHIPIHAFVWFSCRAFGTTMTGRLSLVGTTGAGIFLCLVKKSLLVLLSISGAHVVGVYLGRYL